MLDQLHAIGATAAIIVTAAAFGEMPLVCLLLRQFGAKAPPIEGRKHT